MQSAVVTPELQSPAEDKGVKRSLTTDIRPILKARGRRRGKVLKKVKFIDREHGLPLAECFEFEPEVVESKQSACCELF